MAKQKVWPLDMVRGDSLPLGLTATDENGNLITISAAEKILFGLKKDTRDETCLFTRQAVATGEAGRYTITLYPEDTENLAPGVYKYDVSLHSAGEIFHIIWPSDFTVVGNVTGRGDAV